MTQSKPRTILSGASELSTVMYRGAASQELGQGDFPGTFLATNEAPAAQYGRVTKYFVIAKRFLDMDAPEAKTISSEFLHTHPDDAPNFDPEDEDVPSDLFLFPTRNWVNHLKAKGFEGTSVGGDRVAFDRSKIFTAEELR